VVGGTARREGERVRGREGEGEEWAVGFSLLIGLCCC
jgi:hypothetical protein